MFKSKEIHRGQKGALADTLISVGLCYIKDGESKKSRFLAKNQYTQMKPLYCENAGSASLSKIGHDLKK